jgi:hypothetical protein
VELSAALAPLALHVAVQKFVVALDNLFQVFHALPYYLHGQETFVDRCVELRDRVTASCTRQQMHPERVDITIVSAVVVAIGVTAAVRAFRSLLLMHLFPIVEVIVVPSGSVTP